MDPTRDISRAAASTANIPVACTLTARAAASQALEWADLADHAIDVIPIDDGVRMLLRADLADSVEDLARRERSCCAFLTISTAVLDDALALEITSENPDALPVISALAGVAPSRPRG